MVSGGGRSSQSWDSEAGRHVPYSINIPANGKAGTECARAQEAEEKTIQ